MPMEALNQIREAEALAEELRQDAQREARDIIKGVEEAIAVENRQSQQFIRDAQQQVIDSARASALREIEAIDARMAAKRGKAREEAEKRVPDAGRLIFERIVCDGDC
jgi:hypothetical protein